MGDGLRQGWRASASDIHAAGLNLVRQQLVFDSSTLETLRLLFEAAPHDALAAGSASVRRTFDMGFSVFSNIACHYSIQCDGHIALDGWVDTLTRKMQALGCSASWLIMWLHRESQSSAHILLADPTKCRKTKVREAVASVVEAAITEHKRLCQPEDGAEDLEDLDPRAVEALSFCEAKLVELKKSVAPVGIASEAASGPSGPPTAVGPWQVTVKHAAANHPDTAQNVPVTVLPAPMTVYSGHSTDVKHIRKTLAAGESFTWDGVTEGLWHGEVPGQGNYSWKCKGSGAQTFHGASWPVPCVDQCPPN